MILYVIFFFSSRRRHTRSYGDWSSDVCSSDLVERAGVAGAGRRRWRWRLRCRWRLRLPEPPEVAIGRRMAAVGLAGATDRRVGVERTGIAERVAGFLGLRRVPAERLVPWGLGLVRSPPPRTAALALLRGGPNEVVVLHAPLVVVAAAAHLAPSRTRVLMRNSPVVSSAVLEATGGATLVGRAMAARATSTSSPSTRSSTVRRSWPVRRSSRVPVARSGTR